MNRSELIDNVAATTGLTGKQAEAAVAAFVDTVIQRTKAGEKVSIFGFGSFNPKARGARVGRNPQTGAPVKIAASKSVGFAPATAYKATLNTRGGTKKATAKKAAPAKATATKATPARAAATKATASGATTTKATATRAAASKATTSRATAAKATAAKATAAKAPAKKATTSVPATKAPAKTAKATAKAPAKTAAKATAKATKKR